MVSKKRASDPQTGRSNPRMTIPTQLVLRALLENPTQEMYGLEICAAAGLPTGTIHPILARLEKEYGWLTSRWEDIDPRAEGRPRRRYYKLTEDGAERARIALAQATTSVRTLGLRTRPAGGIA
jgi:PadR family transcriptional regulator PadR